jgi:hypothetical protein
MAEDVYALTIHYYFNKLIGPYFGTHWHATAAVLLRKNNALIS